VTCQHIAKQWLHKQLTICACNNQSQSQSQSDVMTDGQSANVSWCEAHIWGLQLDFCYCQTVAGLLMWGALSDERTDQPFTIAVGLCQCSHYWVRVLRDS
jgi:hypothetical protein